MEIMQERKKNKTKSKILRVYPTKCHANFHTYESPEYWYNEVLGHAEHESGLISLITIRRRIVIIIKEEDEEEEKEIMRRWRRWRSYQEEEEEEVQIMIIIDNER